MNLVNNVITSFNSAIVVIGGEDKDGMSSDNSVQGLRLVNDTVVSPGGNALDVSANANGNSSNVITGFDVINSILWGSIEGDVTASMLSHSLVEKTSWARQNGNVTGNPRFVNSTSGNYRLMPKSPRVTKERRAVLPRSTSWATFDRGTILTSVRIKAPESTETRTQIASSVAAGI